ncbi:MAG: hypothetical protein U5L09_10210 [Bacteroidales bacterium]|nr:hypothetical protein [Bacteroidales bacterium]
MSFIPSVFIINEITDPKQRKVIERIISEKKLIVYEHKAEEYADIMSLKVKNLSFEDCSVWYYAMKLDGILLTGDGRLRKAAKNSGIEVKGIFFIIDRLVEHNKINKTEAIEKLRLLSKNNQRLPKSEIIKRIEIWSKNRKLF